MLQRARCMASLTYSISNLGPCHSFLGWGAAWAGRLQGGSRRLLGLGVLPLQGLQYGLQSLGKHCDDLFLSFPLATVQSSQLVLGGLVSLHLLERAGTFPVHRCWLPGGQKTFGWNCGWCYLNSHVMFLFYLLISEGVCVLVHTAAGCALLPGCNSHSKFLKL